MQIKLISSETVTHEGNSSSGGSRGGAYPSPLFLDQTEAVTKIEH